MRILWVSNDPSQPTGYGTQTKLFAPALAAAGHDVAVLQNTNPEPTYDWNGITVLSPGQRVNFGNDLILAHAERFNPDLVVTCFDAFVVDIKKYSRLPWAAFQMIDCYPLHKELEKSIPAAKVHLCPLTFPEKVVRDAGAVRTAIWPLAFSAFEFFPEDRREARRNFGRMIGAKLDGRLLVVMNAANMSRPSRKNFSAAFEALAILRRNGVDAVLYCHTEMTGEISFGEDLIWQARMHGLDPTCLVFAPQLEYKTMTIGTDFLRTAYNAADCLLVTSYGEGFCLPIIEAYACGTPVVCADYPGASDLVPEEWRVLDGLETTAFPYTKRFAVNPSAVAWRLATLAKQAITVPVDWTQMAASYEIDTVMQRAVTPFLAEWPSLLAASNSVSESRESKEKDNAGTLRAETGQVAGV